MPFRFWLGLHMQTAIHDAAVPVCVSFGRLRKMRRLPMPTGPVFLDSRGFSEIAEHGHYSFSPREYAAFVRRCKDEWGPLLWHASIMDWMCEPPMLAKTGMTVAQHQQLSVNSWVLLNSLDGRLP